MKKKSYYIGFAILAWMCISCRNGCMTCDHNVNLDSVFFEWEHETNSIIARIHTYDSSCVYLMYGDTQPHDEQYYLVNEIIRERECLMKSVLPILINTIDTALIVEKYSLGANIVDVFCNGTKYSYRINPENHLPYFVSIVSANLSEVISSVEKGFYVCYSQGMIYNLCCTTLITKQDENPKTEVLALTINDRLN